jgi:hypothetical protein
MGFRDELRALWDQAADWPTFKREMAETFHDPEYREARQTLSLIAILAAAIYVTALTPVGGYLADLWHWVLPGPAGR